MSDGRTQLAAALGRDTDPLAEYSDTFEGVDFDVFEGFIEQVIRPQNPAERTIINYESSFRHYTTYMEEVAGRHPACPNEDHMLGFIKYLREERDNSDRTVLYKLHNVNRAFKWFADDPAFPHSTDFNPVKNAINRMDYDHKQKEKYRIPVKELRKEVRKIRDIRHRFIIVTQLKLGLRAGELCNVKLSDISLSGRRINEHYPALGTSPQLEGRQNAIYIPHEREGNKSKRPRVLPLDEEVRQVIREWLLIRWDNGEPWLLLSDRSHGKQRPEDLSDVWARYFEDYPEDDEHEAVRSHYGRHRFTTYWAVEQDLNRDLVKYMRGDVSNQVLLGKDSLDAIDSYIHTYYEDIEPVYRDRMFRLRLNE